MTVQIAGQASPQSSRRTPYGSVASRAQTGGRQLALGGRTPQSAAPAASQLTFQDFLKEVDLQFLDHMRRGTSINFADLASDPPPATLHVSAFRRIRQWCYRSYKPALVQRRIIYFLSREGANTQARCTLERSALLQAVLGICLGNRVRTLQCQ